MSTYADLKKKYDALKKTWESRNHADCGRLLEDLKETLPEVALFPNEGRDAEQKVSLSVNFHSEWEINFLTHFQELILVREILEIGAQFSVEQRDIESFERYMAYLKTYYMDYANDLQESVKMYELLGLNLLRLLAQNRLVEFHTELVSNF
jgi:26S proteasome regulatory subunit N12